MGTLESIRRIGDDSVGLVGLVLLGVVIVFGLVTLYPPVRPAFRWALPLGAVAWGASTLYLHGFDRPLTALAGCLLVLGGVTRGAFQLVPMGEAAGTAANLVLVVGLFAEMFARHYHERE